MPDFQQNIGNKQKPENQTNIETAWQVKSKTKIINISKLCRLLDGFLHQKALFGHLVNFYNVFWVNFVENFDKYTHFWQ